MRVAAFIREPCGTSAKIIQNMDVGMHHAKNRGNKEIPLAILSRILAQSCVTLPTSFRQRVTHDCASILDSIAKGTTLFPRFFAWCIPTSIFIQLLNDFCTCSTYFSWFAYKCSLNDFCTCKDIPGRQQDIYMRCKGGHPWCSLSPWYIPGLPGIPDLHSLPKCPWSH